jgi:DNA-binding CsgD family transcriptional regulator
VVTASLSLVASNEEAIQILTFPVLPGKVHRSDPQLKKKIRAFLGNGSGGNGSALVHEFVSGKRSYLCRCFPVNTIVNHNPSSPAHVLVFERRTNNSIVMSEVYDRFGVTPREQQAIQLLLQGLTSKEIASHMNISPNTVKSFIRLVMVKLGVSTRSGIVGKVLGRVPSDLYA